jgi:hypothetical protein
MNKWRALRKRARLAGVKDSDDDESPSCTVTARHTGDGQTGDPTLSLSASTSGEHGNSEGKTRGGTGGAAVGESRKPTPDEEPNDPSQNHLQTAPKDKMASACSPLDTEEDGQPSQHTGIDTPDMPLSRDPREPESTSDDLEEMDTGAAERALQCLLFEQELGNVHTDEQAQNLIAEIANVVIPQHASSDAMKKEDTHADTSHGKGNDVAQETGPIRRSTPFET